MSTQNEEVILRTYGSVWNISRTLHSFQGIKLLVPIVVKDIPYWIISISSALLLNRLPIYNNINWVLKFIVVPVGIFKLLTTIKVDGKLPHKFMWDYLIFMSTPKQYARFKPLSQPKNVKFGSLVFFRRSVVVNKTDLEMKKIKSISKGRR